MVNITVHVMTGLPKIQKVQKVTKGPKSHKRSQKVTKGHKKSQKVIKGLVYVRERLQKVYILS